MASEKSNKAAVLPSPVLITRARVFYLLNRFVHATPAAHVTAPSPGLARTTAQAIAVNRMSLFRWEASEKNLNISRITMLLLVERSYAYWLRGLLLLAVCILPDRAMGANTKEGSIDLTMAAERFRDVKVICQRDHGGLWGISFCGLAESIPGLAFD